jgi:hypothetical protein
MDGADDNSFEDRISIGFARGFSGVKQGGNSVKKHWQTSLNTGE